MKKQIAMVLIMLLTVSEDRATLRSDLSAGTKVGGKGDATRGADKKLVFAIVSFICSEQSPQYGSRNHMLNKQENIVS